jgi:hypothetical protein
MRGVSSIDLERLQNLQLDYLKQARAIIAASEPVEHVAVLQVQVFALDGLDRGPSGGSE